MPPSSPSSQASPSTAASADEKAARRGSGALSNFFQRLGSGGGSAAGKGSRKGSQSPGRSASQDSIPADDKRDEPAARAPHVSPDRSVSELSINEPPLVVHKAESNAAGDLAESHRRPFFIAISGGAASGKKEVCSMIVDKLKSTEARKVAIVKLESFYRELTPEDRVRVDAGTYNFDHPDAVDFKLLETCLVDLAAGKDFSVPVWDFQTLKRLPSTTPTLYHPDIVFVIGPLVLYKKRVRDFFNLRVFIDVDSDTRLANQVIRDTEVRFKKPLETVLTEYLDSVKPAFEDFILPTKKFADVIVPRGATNLVAVDLLAKHVVDVLIEHGADDGAALIGRRPSKLTLAKSPERVMIEVSA